jgi:Zn-dependent protease
VKPEVKETKSSAAFAPGEIWQIVIAWVAMSIALSVGSFFEGSAGVSDFVAAFIALGTGFVFHEMGHKFVAMRLGYVAHFEVWFWGIALALITAVVTRGQFIFGAPGAVYIAPATGAAYLGYSLGKPRNENKDNMEISAAGPGVNLAFSLFFLLLLLIGPTTGFISTIATYGFALNVGLGSFNMLPVPPMDGYKVFKNNIAIALAIALPLWTMFVYFLLGV